MEVGKNTSAIFELFTASNNKLQSPQFWFHEFFGNSESISGFSMNGSNKYYLF